MIKNYYRGPINKSELYLPFLNDEIEFIGFVEDIPKLLSRIDVFVCTSIKEASPTSVWEAMAMGKPVVTTDVGSVSQHIINGVSGYVVPIGDIKALAQKVNYLIENVEHQTLMGKEAIKVVKNRLSVKAAAEKHAYIYSKTIYFAKKINEF